MAHLDAAWTGPSTEFLDFKRECIDKAAELSSFLAHLNHIPLRLATITSAQVVMKGTGATQVRTESRVDPYMILITPTVWLH